VKQKIKRKRIVCGYKTVNTRSDRGKGYELDDVEGYSAEELIAMGSTPEEAEKIAKFMHRDRMRQQRGWKKTRKGEVANTNLAENTNPLDADRSHTQPEDMDVEGWEGKGKQNPMWGHGKKGND